MRFSNRVTRRQAVAAGFAAGGLAARPGLIVAQGATPAPSASPVAAHTPLWRAAADRGIVYGTSLATWQADDAEYLPLVDREAAILFTEDDLLWWRLKPEPGAELDFSFSDRFFDIADEQQQLVFAAHLVWDQGFGEGWTEDDLWGMDPDIASSTLFDTVTAMVERYKGRVAGWLVVNEVIDAHTADGLREDFLWLDTIGPSAIADAFHMTEELDPNALRVLNDFGFETDSEWDAAADRRANALKVIDALLADNVPVQAFGVQAHLDAAGFGERFDAEAYRQFLADIADRGLSILVTELDVLDDDLPADPGPRDQAIADAYARYLEIALDEPAVGSVMTFGLTDRYTWLQEDYPREDGAPRRPLPFDEDLQPKPALDAILGAFDAAPTRDFLWQPPRLE
jgi:endo-1,4-beta-xylanase